MRIVRRKGNRGTCPRAEGRLAGRARAAGAVRAMRATLLAVAAVLVASGPSPSLAAGSPGAAAPAGRRVPVAVSEERVHEVHRRAIVVDTHADTLWRVLDDGDDISVRSAKGHLDVPRLLEGGVDGQFFALWPQPAYASSGYAKRCLRLLDAFHGVVERSGGRLIAATTPDEIRRADREGKVAALLGIEGGHAIENDLGLLRMFHRMGVRYMTLTWSIHTDWADSSSQSPRARGLTPFGEEVVREMNRLGMLVDVSHVSDATFRDVLRVTKAPVIASHSSCRAICDAPRNMSDDMLRALAENGGVVMINYYSAFLDGEFRRRSDEAEEGAKERIRRIQDETRGDPVARETRMWALYAELDGSIPPPPLDRLIEHIVHAVEVAGIDHVGLGSDFDGITSAPRGLEDVTRLPSITRALLERGFGEDEVIRILGGNFLRVFDEASRIASGR